jgi:hypothetical protein
MHEKKIFFLFLKREINLKVLRFFFNFLNCFRKVSEEIEYLNT